MHFVLLAGLALPRMFIWYSLVEPQLLEGFPFVINNGL
jgi:hypothetical protein